MPIEPTVAQLVSNIRSSGLSIYDPIQVGDPQLWFGASELEAALNHSLRGLRLAHYALRTRSKVVKQRVCEAMGYPVPESFQKTKPRFPGQELDIYSQKSNNLQIWNDEIGPARRYGIVQVDANGVVSRVRVVSGDVLARLDRTGTLTQKYQARFVPSSTPTELIGELDTAAVRGAMRTGTEHRTFSASPAAHASPETLLPIAEVFRRLVPLVGTDVPMVGADQERLRGAHLHRAVCSALGYAQYADAGDFPDVRHQLLEVKLQTSPTIDLGLVTPDSPALLDVRQLGATQVRHSDVRYAVFYGVVRGGAVRLTHLVVTPGERFFDRFVAFGGKVLNKKLQIRLPSDFFLQPE